MCSVVFMASSLRVASRAVVRPYSRLFSRSSSDSKLEETMSLVSRRVGDLGPQLVKGLSGEEGYFVADNVLGKEMLATLRAEAASLYEQGKFAKSQSTRWCPKEKRPVFYDKNNVFAMQLMGGDAYFDSPRLTEYVVSLIKTVVPILSAAFPEAQLSSTMASNKLAVCVGDGSAYDKHYDNAGLEDTRKVTILYYMNPSWREENGGVFRIYKRDGGVADVAPLGDRVLAFWSDRLVHSVEPSFAQRGAEDHRYALTVWLTATTTAAIDRDDEMVKRHFG